jgi:hypothetical protein
MRNNGQFQKSLNKLVNCGCCEKLTHSSIDGMIGIGLCRICYDSSGLYNEHVDGYHNDDGCPDECPIKYDLECLCERI